MRQYLYIRPVFEESVGLFLHFVVRNTLQYGIGQLLTWFSDSLPIRQKRNGDLISYKS
jgi:hypothetical protein